MLERSKNNGKIKSKGALIPSIYGMERVVSFGFDGEFLEESWPESDESGFNFQVINQ